MVPAVLLAAVYIHHAQVRSNLQEQTVLPSSKQLCLRAQSIKAKSAHQREQNVFPVLLDRSAVLRLYMPQLKLVHASTREAWSHIQ